MKLFSPRLRLGVAALWAGSLWAVGIAAATLSAVLTDRAAFGQIASVLFHVEARVALVCFVLMLLACRDPAMDAGKRRASIILCVAMLCCVIGYFAIQPMLATMRAAAGPGGVMASDEAHRFGMLHGVSMLFYLIQAVLGLVLVRKNV